MSQIPYSQDESELARFFVQRYIPAKNLTEHSTKSYFAAIRSFGRHLGHPAGYQDLTAKNFQAWRETLKHKVDRYLLSVWRFAAQEGNAEWPSEFKNRVEGSEPREQKVLRYFRETYLPERAAEGELTPNTIKSYRYAVNKFDQYTCAGKASVIKNINRKRLEGFRKWLEDINVNPRKAKAMADVIRTVCRRAYPDGWLPKSERTIVEKMSDDALATVLEERFLPVRTNIASSETVSKLHNAIRRFSRHLGHTATLADLTDQNVGSFMRWVVADGRSARTANGYRSKLLSLWNWCARKGLVDQFPTIPKLPEPEKIPVAWTAMEMRRLLTACSQMPGTVSDIHAPDYFRAFILLDWDTAERSGALFQLRWEWLSLDEGCLTMPAESRKGGRKAMFYKLKPSTVRALRMIAKPERELVFPFPRKQGKDWFYRQWKKLLKRADLPYVKYKSGPQKIRRSVASHMEAAGGNATKYLAHSARGLTEKSYLDPRIVGTGPGNEVLFDLDGPTT